MESNEYREGGQKSAGLCLNSRLEGYERYPARTQNMAFEHRVREVQGSLKPSPMMKGKATQSIQVGWESPTTTSVSSSGAHTLGEAYALLTTSNHADRFLWEASLCLSASYWRKYKLHPLDQDII